MGSVGDRAGSGITEDRGQKAEDGRQRTDCFTMKIGILGGTFNPPHIGHLILAEYVRIELGLNRIIFIPCNIPPHKLDNEYLPADTRIKMLKSALGRYRQFSVSPLEVNRGGVSYTSDTLVELKKRFPKDKFFLIIGSDLYKDLSLWKDSDSLSKMAEVVVVMRGKVKKNRRRGFVFISMPKINISSSSVRGMVRKGESVSCFVPYGVDRFIQEHRLYR